MIYLDKNENLVSFCPGIRRILEEYKGGALKSYPASVRSEEHPLEALLSSMLALILPSFHWVRAQKHC